MGLSSRVMVGVLRVDLAIPGARTLKDRRQVLRSLRDKVRHAFSVSCNELSPSEHPTRGELVVTTAGDDGALIRQTIDRVAQLLRTHPSAVVTQMDIEVFPWHPDDQSWADIASADELSMDAPWAEPAAAGPGGWRGEDDDG
jgi:uncharacterized protein